MVRYFIWTIMILVIVCKLTAMLIIDNYGIELKQLTKNKIELLRMWRNDPKISQYLITRTYITPEMQAKWFQSISNSKCYYFMINCQGEDIGLVNLKDIDYEKKCAEPGIFIYEDNYLNGDISFRAALNNMDFAFDVLRLESLYGYVLKENRRARRFNSALGYTVAPNQEDESIQLYRVSKDQYYIAREKIRSIL